LGSAVTAGFSADASCSICCLATLPFYGYEDFYLSTIGETEPIEYYSSGKDPDTGNVRTIEMEGDPGFPDLTYVRASDLCCSYGAPRDQDTGVLYDEDLDDVYVCNGDGAGSNVSISGNNIICSVPPLTMSDSASHKWQLRISLNGQDYHGVLASEPMTSYAGIEYLAQSCDLGYYAPSDKAVCKICNPGSYDGRTGTIKYQSHTSCTPCEVGKYQEDYGATECNYCPYLPDENVEVSDTRATTSNAAGTKFFTSQISIDACSCKSFYYRNTLLTDCSDNDENDLSLCCSKCPNGATCLGGFSVAPPQSFYQLTGKNVPSTAIPTGWFINDVTGNVSNEMYHTMPYAKPGYYRLDAQKEGLIVQCVPPEACLGGKQKSNKIQYENVCALGYEGNMCSQCSAGFYKDNEYCKKCPTKSPIIIVIGSLCIIGGLYLFATWGRHLKGLGSPRILVNFVTVTYSFTYFNIDWPPELLDFLEKLKFFTINIDLIHAECEVNLTYEEGFFFFMSIPFIIGEIFLFLYMLDSFLNWFKYRAHASSCPNALSCHGKSSVMLFPCLHSMCEECAKTSFPQHKYSKSECSVCGRKVIASSKVLGIWGNLTMAQKWKRAKTVILKDFTFLLKNIFKHWLRALLGAAWGKEVIPEDIVEVEEEDDDQGEGDNSEDHPKRSPLDRRQSYRSDLQKTLLERRSSDIYRSKKSKYNWMEAGVGRTGSSMSVSMRRQSSRALSEEKGSEGSDSKPNRSMRRLNSEPDSFYKINSSDAVDPFFGPWRPEQHFLDGRIPVSSHDRWVNGFLPSLLCLIASPLWILMDVRRLWKGNNQAYITSFYRIRLEVWYFIQSIMNLVQLILNDLIVKGILGGLPVLVLIIVFFGIFRVWSKIRQIIKKSAEEEDGDEDDDDENHDHEDDDPNGNEPGTQSANGHVGQSKLTSGSMKAGTNVETTTEKYIIKIWAFYFPYLGQETLRSILCFLLSTFFGLLFSALDVLLQFSANMIRYCMKTWKVIQERGFMAAEITIGKVISDDILVQIARNIENEHVVEHSIVYKLRKLYGLFEEDQMKRKQLTDRFSLETSSAGKKRTRRSSFLDTLSSPFRPSTELNRFIDNDDDEDDDDDIDAIFGGRLSFALPSMVGVSPTSETPLPSISRSDSLSRALEQEQEEKSAQEGRDSYYTNPAFGADKRESRKTRRNSSSSSSSHNVSSSRRKKRGLSLGVHSQSHVVNKDAPYQEENEDEPSYHIRMVETDVNILQINVLERLSLKVGLIGRILRIFTLSLNLIAWLGVAFLLLPFLRIAAFLSWIFTPGRGRLIKGPQTEFTSLEEGSWIRCEIEGFKEVRKVLSVGSNALLILDDPLSDFDLRDTPFYSITRQEVTKAVVERLGSDLSREHAIEVLIKEGYTYVAGRDISFKREMDKVSQEELLEAVGKQFGTWKKERGLISTNGHIVKGSFEKQFFDWHLMRLAIVNMVLSLKRRFVRLWLFNKEHLLFKEDVPELTTYQLEYELKLRKIPVPDALMGDEQNLRFLQGLLMSHLSHKPAKDGETKEDKKARDLKMMRKVAFLPSFSSRYFGNLSSDYDHERDAYDDDDDDEHLNDLKDIDETKEEKTKEKSLRDSSRALLTSMIDHSRSFFRGLPTRASSRGSEEEKSMANLGSLSMLFKQKARLIVRSLRLLFFVITYLCLVLSSPVLLLITYILSLFPSMSEYFPNAVNV
jgi:hypothetical protein